MQWIADYLNGYQLKQGVIRVYLGLGLFMLDVYELHCSKTYQ